MSDYSISVNQFARFKRVSNSKKLGIIRRQKNPDTNMVPWYQMTRSKIKKSIELKGDLKPVVEGINTLSNRKADTVQKNRMRNGSIDGLKKYMEMQLPKVLLDLDYSIIKPTQKSINISGVDIKVAPDIVVRAVVNGETVLGAVKIHICKGDKFDNQQCQIVSAILFEYLQSKVATNGEVVLPELCFSLDIFSGRMVSAKNIPNSVYKDIQLLCDEVKEIWKTIAAA